MGAFAAVARGVETAFPIGVFAARALAGWIGDIGLAVAVEVGAFPHQAGAERQMPRRRPGGETREPDVAALAVEGLRAHRRLGDAQRTCRQDQRR